MIGERFIPLPGHRVPFIPLVKTGDHDWLELFHGVVLEKLETVSFIPESEQIGDFLGTLERAALATSVQDAL